jgi:flagellar basal-body rod protein FlgB
MASRRTAVIGDEMALELDFGGAWLGTPVAHGCRRRQRLLGDGMSSIFGSPISTLAEAMRFRVARQAALASNVSNADTPGYRRVDLDFDALLGEAATRLARTDPRHLGPGSDPANPYRLERGPRGTRPDGNGVDLHSELIELSRNAGAFRDQAEVLSRWFALHRIAFTDERR